MRFLPIQLVQPGMIVGKDVINRSNSKTKMVTKGAILTQEYIDNLFSHGYMGLYISDLVSEDVEISELVSSETLQECIDAVAEANIGHIFNMSTQIVRDISSKKDNLHVDLIDLRSFDDYTYHHSVNVAIYAVAVGTRMGISEKEINYLSQAAICHDLGKMKIPEEILNKPGKLTDEEYEIIKTHPKESYNILSQNSEVSAIVKQAVLFHHENINGSGYPMKKTGEELPLIAKIIHAVDVYDALTSKRPYKEPYAPIAAFEYLRGGVDILFDKEVVDAMEQVIPAYPPGTDVKLSNGKVAVVIRHTTDALRPVVKTVDDLVVIDLSAPEHSKIRIESSGVMIADYSSEIELLNETKIAPSNQKKKIIVVDDTPAALLQTRAALGMDYEIDTVQSAQAAFRSIKENGKPDLLIVDIEMPEMDGVSFVEMYKDVYGDDTPIMFLTASSDRAVVGRCIEVGAVDYIVKPAKRVYLQERVAYALKETRE